MEHNNNIINELKTKNAGLESHVDMLETEISYLHEILLRCGFPEGLTTLKATVEEMLAEEEQHHNE